MQKLFENWRKLLEGEVIQGPWQSAEESRKHAEIANEIETLILQHMKEIHGNPLQWSDDQADAVEQIDNLLNVLFPSGE